MPRRLTTWPRANAREIQAMLLEHRQAVSQRPGLAMLNRKQDQRLVMIVHIALLPIIIPTLLQLHLLSLISSRNNEKARTVPLTILYALGQHIQPIHPGRHLTRDGGAGARRVLRNELGGFGRRRDVLPFQPFEVR